MSVQLDLWKRRAGILKEGTVDVSGMINEEGKILGKLKPTGYRVSSSVHQHPDEKHYNTNTLIHKGEINGKKFVAHKHVSHPIHFLTKHSEPEKHAIINHLKQHNYYVNEETDFLLGEKESINESSVENAQMYLKMLRDGVPEDDASEVHKNIDKAEEHINKGNHLRALIHVVKASRAFARYHGK